MYKILILILVIKEMLLSLSSDLLSKLFFSQINGDQYQINFITV